MSRHFAVRGSGSFPFHLLARDQCWPATEHEAQKIVLACPTVAPPQLIVMATDRTFPSADAWAQAKWPIQR